MSDNAQSAGRGPSSTEAVLKLMYPQYRRAQSPATSRDTPSAEPGWPRRPADWGCRRPRPAGCPERDFLETVPRSLDQLSESCSSSKPGEPATHRLLSCSGHAGTGWQSVIGRLTNGWRGGQPRVWQCRPIRLPSPLRSVEVDSGLHARISFPFAQSGRGRTWIVLPAIELRQHGKESIGAV